MSALRFSRPGIAGTTLQYLGPTPDVRSAGHRFYLLSEVAPTRTLAPGNVERTKRAFKRHPYNGPRCGYILPIAGVPCYRRPHHGRDHRSEATVLADLARRRP